MRILSPFVRGIAACTSGFTLIAALGGPASAAAAEPDVSVPERVSRALASADAAELGGQPEVTTDGAASISAHEPAVSVSTANGWVKVSLLTKASEPSVADGVSQVFPDVATDADSVLRPVVGGAQVLYVMHSDDAPDAQRYQVDLAQGMRVQSTEDGGFFLVDAEGEAVGTIEAPWARDATGRELPTRYRWEGSVLVQETETAGAVFPVVADPKITVGLGVYLNMFGSEARTYAIGIVAMGGSAAAVGCATLDKVPSPLKVLARLACGAGVVSLPKVFAAVKSIANDKRIDDKACYQVKIIPAKSGSKKVKAKNCK